ncbi:MAG: AAA family ATPase [Clostridia bacterium]|nr:AAA family ATPase [Clostridia bacterium]
MNDLYIQGLKIEWSTIPEDSYVHKIPAIKSITELQFKKPVTFFVGENGSGKSTLLEAMAVEFGYNSEGGTRNYNFSTYYDISSLSESITLVKGWQRPKSGYFFRAETFFNVATASMFDYMGADYHTNSHGEGNLNFLVYDKPGLYLMDEPEAALSPLRQLTLLRHIYDMSRKGAQFIIATHSPILLGCPHSQILSFDNGKISPCDYENTLSYQITKDFLFNKEKMLKELLDD